MQAQTRIFLSLYGGLSFFIPNFLTNYYLPKAKDAFLSAGLAPPWTVMPPFPLGHWIEVWSVPLGIILYYLPNILEKLKIKPRAELLASSSFFVVFASYIGTIPNYGVIHADLLFSLALSAIVGFSYGLSANKFNTDYLSNESIDKSARIAKLNSIRDKWLRAMNMFLGVCLALVVGSSFKFFFEEKSTIPTAAQEVFRTSTSVVLTWISLGLMFGIFMQMFGKISELENQFEQIKKEDDPGNN